jgi:hypothetical protein
MKYWNDIQGRWEPFDVAVTHPGQICTFDLRMMNYVGDSETYKQSSADVAHKEALAGRKEPVDMGHNVLRGVLDLCMLPNIEKRL